MEAFWLSQKIRPLRIKYKITLTSLVDYLLIERNTIYLVEIGMINDYRIVEIVYQAVNTKLGQKISA